MYPFPDRISSTPQPHRKGICHQNRTPVVTRTWIVNTPRVGSGRRRDGPLTHSYPSAHTADEFWA